MNLLKIGLPFFLLAFSSTAIAAGNTRLRRSYLCAYMLWVLILRASTIHMV